MEPIRSFIAIELPDELKRTLIQLQDHLKAGQSGVKWVSPQGIHLTLKFLGNITTGSIDEIILAMAKATEGISPFRLKIKDLGVFPNLKRIQVVWVGVSGEVDQVSSMQRRIESELAPLGFTPESRPFTPHLTLGRLNDRVSLSERQRLGQLIAGTRFEATYDFRVDFIHLIKSQLTREGAIYSRIGSIKLKEPLSTGSD